MIIDTHCHIQFKPLNKDIEGVMRRANDSGVYKFIVVGCDLTTSEQAVEIAQKYHNTFASIGIHPHDAGTITDPIWEKLKELTKNRQVIAIGETGLDYFRNLSVKDEQISAFKRHIKLALELDLPLIVHNRDADDESLKILQEHNVKKAVFHCFGSDVEFARKVWMAGYMTSFTGNITYPKAHDLHRVVEECPMDAMMVETDCPYLAPQKYRGGTNEPAYVVEVVREIANLKGKKFSEIAQVTSKNADEFFKI